MKKVLLSAITSLALQGLSIAQNVPTYVSSNGLQGWWSFDGNANDETGNGHDGTVNGATLTSDRNGISNAAYSFNGSNQSITVPDHDSLSFPTNIFTFSFWLNWNPNASQELAIMGKRGSMTSNFEYYINKNATTGTNPDCIFPHTWTLPGSNVYILPSVLSSNTTSGVWQHIVIAADGISLRMYKNGVLVDSTVAPTINMGNSTGNLTFGTGGGWGSTNWMNGSLDDIGIWRRALTHLEIDALYNSLSVSSQEIAPNHKVLVYPNPSSNQFTLVSDLKYIGSKFTLYDYVGKAVISGQIESEHTSMDLSGMVNGIYFLSIDEHSKQYIKVIKQ